MFKVILYILLASLSAESKDITVGISTLPSSSDVPNTRSVNKSQILRQIYDSLFFMDEFGKFRSVYFKSWNFNKKKLSYEFFLNENIKFSDGSSIEIDEIINALNRGFNGEFYYSTSIKSIKASDTNKITIILSKEDSSFLVKLTDLVFSVFKEPSSKTIFPIGTGTFRVIQNSEKKITLIRNNFHNDFKLGNISQITYVLVQKTVLNEHDISTLNLNFFPFFQIHESEKILTKFKRIVYPSHRIATFVLNIKKDAIRSIIASCINPSELVELPYFKFDTQSYNSIIPSGIENYQSSNVDSRYNILECTKKIKSLKSIKLVWLNTYTAQEDLIFLSSLINRLNKLAGHDLLTLKTLSLNEAQPVILNGNYDLFLCSISPPIPLVDRIFSDFIFSKKNPNSLIKYYDSTISSKLSKLQLHEYNNRSKYINDLEATLISKNWVIPIGRKITTFYIPKNWTGIENLNGMNGNIYLGKIKANE